MEQNTLTECPKVNTYNFQGSSIKIVVRLPKSLENSDRAEQLDKADKAKDGIETFKNLIIFITTEDTFSSSLKQDVSTDTNEVSKNPNVTTLIEIIEGSNTKSEPSEESQAHLCNPIVEAEFKSEVSMENESSKLVVVEDLGTRDKRFRGLWSWVRSSLTPEMQRKKGKTWTSVVNESEKRNANEEETHPNVFEQEVNDEVPEIGAVALDEDLKGDTVVQESTTSNIMVKTSPICIEEVQHPTIFDISKVQDAQEGCSTEAPITKRLFKANNCCPEVQEELVYRSFTGRDLAVSQDLLDEDVNSFFEKPHEETDDQELHQKEDEAVEVKLDDKNEEVLVLAKHQRSSFISRLDKAIHKSKYKKVKVKESSEAIPKPESETISLNLEPTDECLTLSRDDKSTLNRDKHDDEVSFQEDFELLFLDSSKDTNLAGYQNDVVLISYKKRNED